MSFSVKVINNFLLIDTKEAHRVNVAEVTYSCKHGIQLKTCIDSHRICYMWTNFLFELYHCLLHRISNFNTDTVMQQKKKKKKGSNFLFQQIVSFYNASFTPATYIILFQVSALCEVMGRYYLQSVGLITRHVFETQYGDKAK